MAITAYAAGVADPENNSTEDITVLEADVAANKEVTLYGDASDTTNNSWPAANGSDVTWAWTMLSKPKDSSAAFKVVNGASTATSRNPTITAIDVWGNYRFLLVATNTTTSTSSESDPLKVVDSAIVTIRVKSTTAGIEKPAPGERNWHDELHVWADKINANAAGDTHTLQAGNTDITNATGADVEQLTQGAYALDPASTSNPLHKHQGQHVDVAGRQTAFDNTVSTGLAYSGVVYLEEAPVNAAAPKVITQERIIYTGHANGTNSVYEVEKEIIGAGANTLVKGTIHQVIQTDYIQAVNNAIGGDTLNQLLVPNYHIAFHIREAVTLDSWSVSLQDGGTQTNVGGLSIAGYSFKLQTAASIEALESNTFVSLNTTAVEPTPTQDHGPAAAQANSLGISLAAGSYLCVVCTRAPSGYRAIQKDNVTIGKVDYRGRGLSATVNCLRLV